MCPAKYVVYSSSGNRALRRKLGAGRGVLWRSTSCEREGRKQDVQAEELQHQTRILDGMNPRKQISSVHCELPLDKGKASDNRTNDC